jgi:hypothetical protein
MLSLEKNPSNHCIKGWVDPRAGLYIMEKRKSLAPRGTRTPDCPAHSLVTRQTMLLSFLIWQEMLPFIYKYICFPFLTESCRKTVPAPSSVLLNIWGLWCWIIRKTLQFHCLLITLTALNQSLHNKFSWWCDTQHFVSNFCSEIMNKVYCIKRNPLHSLQDEAFWIKPKTRHVTVQETQLQTTAI